MRRDLLMHVGKKFYTRESFIEEARSIGASKRVPCVPDIAIGVSRCFCEQDNEVFCYFVIDAIEEVGQKTDDRTDYVSEEEAALEDERGCGHREKGIYIVSFSEAEIIDPPIPCPFNIGRSFMYIDGDASLEKREIVRIGRPERPSKRKEEALRAQGYVPLTTFTTFYPQYARRLCREGKIPGLKVAGRWWVKPEDYRKYERR